MSVEESSDFDLLEYLRIALRWRWYLIIPAVLVLGIAVVAAFVWPPTYRSTATILIEQQQIPQDLVRSTVTSYADQRIQAISTRVMSTANLARTIEKFDLYPEAREKNPIARVASMMREDIELEMVSADVVDPHSGYSTRATIAFNLSFNSRSPTDAQKVTNDLVELFLNENVRIRRQAVRDTSAFFAGEARRLASAISEKEAELASFNERHADSLPEMEGINRQLLRRVESDLRDNSNDKRMLEDRLVFLGAQLAQVSPFAAVGAEATEGEVLDPADRLRVLEAEYIALASRYTAAHPDRKRVEREILELSRLTGIVSGVVLEEALTDLENELAKLEEQHPPGHPEIQKKQREIGEVRAELASSKQRSGSTTARTNRARDPAYVQLEAQVQAARAELESLDERRIVLEEDQRELEARLSATPKIESEYLELTRDYENTREQYQQIKAQQLEAELAESLESKSKAERFVLIEPPVVPDKPDKPDRIKILLMGFVLAGGSGLGSVVVREFLDNSIRGTKQLIALIGAPPIAVIPYLATSEETTAKRRRIVFFAVLIGLLVVTAVIGFHFVVKPLDVAIAEILGKAA